jgi:hypothetical protein
MSKKPADREHRRADVRSARRRAENRSRRRRHGGVISTTSRSMNSNTKVSNAAKELKNADSAERTAGPSAPDNSTAPRTPAPAFTPCRAPSRRPMTTAARPPPGCCAHWRSARAAARFATRRSSRCSGPLPPSALPTCFTRRPSGRSARSRTFSRCPPRSALPSPSSLPILVFFAFSIMMARAREMRSAARSMAEVALRLAEPENIAGDRILTVGQAVRREVSAMNEGIERTIARASELETLVHSEVNALERSYSATTRSASVAWSRNWAPNATPSSATPSASAPPSPAPMRTAQGRTDHRQRRNRPPDLHLGRRPRAIAGQHARPICRSARMRNQPRPRSGSLRPHRGA